MPTSGRDRYTGGSSSAYSPFMRQPQEDKSHSTRIILALVLTLLLPPLGILYAWRAGVFPLPGRIALTLFALLLTGGIFYATMPDTTPQPITPTPGSPERITAVSETDVTTALSNIDALLGIPEDIVVAETPAPSLSPEEEAELARQQEILSTVVFAVAEEAKYYHVAPMCRDQENPRQLTIGEAINEGLQPCGRCKPPTL